ncbi:hypothetical protein GCM10022224_094980 [Nonomuraea antimicrobica]|uniref:Uncharacterized protein n=1 Tax=Nonomuraea antimicrobica TaxID=561173 RepID=A0ABP7E731_9ACTN
MADLDGGIVAGGDKAKAASHCPDSTRAQAIQKWAGLAGSPISITRWQSLITLEGSQPDPEQALAYVESRVTHHAGGAAAWGERGLPGRFSGGLSPPVPVPGAFMRWTGGVVITP